MNRFDFRKIVICHFDDVILIAINCAIIEHWFRHKNPQMKNHFTIWKNQCISRLNHKRNSSETGKKNQKKSQSAFRASIPVRKWGEQDHEKQIHSNWFTLIASSFNRLSFSAKYVHLNRTLERALASHLIVQHTNESHFEKQKNTFYVYVQKNYHEYRFEVNLS